MKKFNDYNEVQTYSNNPKLPAGAYVLKIINVKTEEMDWGNRIVVAFDVAEGEQKDFYKKQFEANTSEDKKWKGVYRITEPNDDGSETDTCRKRILKSFVTALEESNAGYSWDWDETKWKGKQIGGVFGEYTDEINGKNATWVRLRWVDSVKNVKSGKSRLADPYVSNRVKNNAPTEPTTNEWMNIPAGTDEEIPF